jgi:hypothetical protein
MDSTQPTQSTIQTVAQIETPMDKVLPSTDNQHFNLAGLEQRIDNSLEDMEQSHQLALEYCQKHPDLVPFKDAIINEAMAALWESHLNDNEPIDDRKAIEQGIQRFQQKLGEYHHQQTQKTNQQTLQQQLLKLNTGISAPHAQPHSISQTLKAIGDNDKAFSQYRQHYLNQKGIS